MAINTQTYENPAVFRAAVDAFLRANLGDYNQLFSLIQGITAQSVQRYRSWMVRLDHDGATCGVALIHCVPPARRLIVTQLDRAGAAALVKALDAAALRPDGLTGPPEAAILLARQLGMSFRERFRMGNHRLDRPPEKVFCAGFARPATLEDLPLLTHWEQQFIRECRLPESPATVAEEVRLRLAEPEPLYWLWCVDGAPVAMALGRSRPPAARIGMVYTLPAQRGRGYAGALVSGVAATLMAHHCEAVFLYTDLANATSNGVYLRIGFRRIGESVYLDLNEAEHQWEDGT